MLSMLCDLEQIVLQVTYEQIGQSEFKRVSGSPMWDKLRAVVTDIGPPTVPIILRRLVRLGLLVKDVASSSKLTAVYGPTEFGYRSLQTEVAATP